MTPRDLVAAHLPLVRALASRMKRTTLTGSELDDIVGYGVIGLCEAAARYREGDGTPFAAFSFMRIRGAMIDGARLSLGSNSHGMGMLESGRVLITDAIEAVTGEPIDEEGALDRARIIRALREAIAGLPERERLLVEAVDLRGRKLEDVGADMGVTKSWASRLRKGALEVVRARLEGRDFS